MTADATGIATGVSATGSIVRRIDHVNIATQDPAALAGLLTRTLGLTEAWPLNDAGGYVTIGLAAGTSCTLAVDRSDGAVPFLVPGERSRFSTVAFAPVPTEAALTELDRRHIPHTDPHVFPAWTNTLLPGLLDDEDMAFLCEYTTEDWFEELKAQVVRRFTDNGGGPAGVSGLVEVVVTTADLAAGQARWERLLGPPDAAATWAFADPPALVLRPGTTDRVSHVTFAVADFEHAKTATEDMGLLLDRADGELLLDPQALDGLDIRLRAVSDDRRSA
jgi:catechol 2,3-dioxygenase-like lactoylglutathione lyase family enzyme